MYKYIFMTNVNKNDCIYQYLQKINSLQSYEKLDEIT